MSDARHVVPPVEFWEPQVHQSPVELSVTISAPRTPSNAPETDPDADTADAAESATSGTLNAQSDTAAKPAGQPSREAKD